MALNPDGHDVDDRTGEAVDDSLLERAGRLARDRRPDGWPQVSERIRSRLRSVASPAQEFAAYDAPGARGSRVTVTSRVLLPVLRDALDDETRLADAIDLVAGPRDDGRRRLGGVRLELVCRFGLDLHEEGAEARRIVGAVVREVLGRDPAFDADRDVAVTIVDVVVGDPALA